MLRRKAAALILTILIILCALPAGARAADGITYEFAFAVHTISGDQYVRHVGPDTGEDVLHDDECYIIYMTIHNQTGQALHYDVAELMIDGASYRWEDVTVKTGYSLRLSRESMARIQPGPHECALRLDGQIVHKNSFMMPRNWAGAMRLPTETQLSSYKSGARSPYIAFYTNFPAGGMTEYSIDIHTDHKPLGTYICPINWWMDLSALESKYARVWADYGGAGGGYCGLQVWNDGTMGVIMTLWDVFTEDYNGHVDHIKARVLYPADAYDTDHDDSGEGSFVHYSYPFDWKPGRDYRLLLQQSTGDNGNTLLTLWIKDLAANAWTKLFCFDTGLKDVWIGYTGGFLECFNVSTAPQVRTMELWNVRAHMRSSGRWVNADSMTFAVNASVGLSDYEGSYNFGRDGRSCWIITSGIPGLCRPESNTGPYQVPTTESGQPYD